MSEEVTLNGVADDLLSEDVPSLAEYADEPGGAWAKGWYTAEIIEGYSTRNGKQFVTEDEPSKRGDSRNLRMCFKVTRLNGEERNMQESFNYRVSDFTAERLQYIKEMRAEYKSVKGKWLGAEDAQRTSLAIAKLGQLEKAIGLKLKRTPQGNLVAGVFIGQKLDVYLSVDENGYNEVKQFAKLGDKAPQPRKA